ncbi:External alternative NAD(P)H-ubiquinone oxidoreductase B2 [Yarrowia sp. B02]|nr:External alternative NAD(P)H-ubiquinone oxidoreductase B2 [Yarrowia sp. B02]
MLRPLTRVGAMGAMGAVARPAAARTAFRSLHSSRPALQKQKSAISRTTKILRLGLATFGAIGLTATALVVGFLAYDYSSYKEIDDCGEIDVHALALSPRRGGPKNLPIFDSWLDDTDTPEKEESSAKPRLVVLGSGWGSIALLNALKPGDYNVTLVSPSNYFLFTPMLPSATVGTLELRSITEPVRRLCAAAAAHFVNASADDIDFKERLIECSQRDPVTGDQVSFYVPYDKVVVGVGCTTNTHGVKGLEYVHFLKTVDDSKSIRNQLVANLEKAALPSTSNEERKKLLSFVVCGGGPTGVEMAAEVYDLMNEDLAKHYPKALRNLVSVHVIQSRSAILNTFDKSVSEYAMERFKHDNIDLLTDSRVVEVKEDRVLFKQTDPNDPSKKIIKEVPFGLCLWSTGVDQAPLTKSIVKEIGPPEQNNRRAIETDPQLRILGTPQGQAYAIGDCSTVRTHVLETALDYLKAHVIASRPFSANTPETPEALEKRVHEIKLTVGEVKKLTALLQKTLPDSAEHFVRVDQLFEEYDVDHSGTLSYKELTTMLKDVDQKITSLPATAQRANQQGVYLGKKLRKMASIGEAAFDKPVPYGDIDAAYYKPFKYKHLGNLAYLGNAAVFDFGKHGTFTGGLLGMYIWRSAYFSQCVSFRTRALMFQDWVKRGLFGRDFIAP